MRWNWIRKYVVSNVLLSWFNKFLFFFSIFKSFDLSTFFFCFSSKSRHSIPNMISDNSSFFHIQFNTFADAFFCTQQVVYFLLPLFSSPFFFMLKTSLSDTTAEEIPFSILFIFRATFKLSSFYLFFSTILLLRKEKNKKTIYLR